MRRLALAALLLAAAAPAWAQDPHAGHATTQQPAPDPHAGHDMGAASAEAAEIGNAAPPAPPKDHAADAVWGAGEMAGARRTLRRENGAFTGSMLLVDLAEYQLRRGRDGYRLEGEAW